MHRMLACLLCLVIAGVPSLWSADAPEAARPDRPGAATHLLNLALLVAGNDATDGGDPLPAPVAKAVNDIKDFLPYKHYKMYDSVVVRTTNREPVRVDLEGPEPLRYVANCGYELTGDGTKLNFTRFEVVRAYAPVAPRAPSGEGRDATTPTPQAGPPPEVISTGFTVSVGETIVVGTSRLKGTGKALVIVLTVLLAK